MYKARYYKADGTEDGARDLPDSIFDGVVNEGVLHQVVKAYLANQRQGTGSAKNRSDVRGGSRKPWRQKGTGRARQGTIRAVQWAGGGRAFPPIPHSWRQRVPRKVKALARRSAFNARAQDDRVLLVEALSLEAPKTRAVREYLAAVGAEGAKVLLLTHGIRETVYLSARNLPGVEVRRFGDESSYDILLADLVLIESDALEAYEDEADGEEVPAAEEAAAPESEAEETEAAATTATEEEPAATEASAPEASASAEEDAADEDESDDDEEARDA